jgi:hypothetical protein
VQLRVSGKLLWVYVISFLPFHRRHPRRTGTDFYNGVRFFIQWAYFFQWVFDLYSGRFSFSGFSIGTVGKICAVGFRFFFMQWAVSFFQRVFVVFVPWENFLQWGFIFILWAICFFVQWIFVFVQGRIFTVGFDFFFHTVGDLFFSGFTLLYSGRIVTVGILVYGCFSYLAVGVETFVRILHRWGV